MPKWSEPFQRVLREYAESLAVAIVLAVVIRLFIVSPFAITTESMAPTLISGDFALGYHLPFGVQVFGFKFGGRAPVIGDVIAFRCPGDSSRFCIKRVVALAGDRVEIKNGVFIYNAKSHGVAEGAPDFGPFIVPPENVFVLNDARQLASDSRQFGPLPMEQIQSKVVGIWMSLDWRAESFWPEVRWPRVFTRVR